MVGPRVNRADLPVWTHLEGLMFGELSDRRKAVQLPSYCRATGLSADTGMAMLATWAKKCAWPANSYEKQAGSAQGGGQQAYFVAVKCLKRLHRLRCSNRL